MTLASATDVMIYLFGRSRNGGIDILLHDWRVLVKFSESLPLDSHNRYTDTGLGGHPELTFQL